MRHQIILSAMEEGGPALNIPLPLVILPKTTGHSGAPTFQPDCIDTLHIRQ